MTAIVKNDKCTKSDYRQLFAGSAEPLRWLCDTLTGDLQFSDRILKAALTQSLKDAEHVFRERMASWARRLIIKACIETMRPWKSSLAEVAYQLYAMRLAAIDPADVARTINVSAGVLQPRLLRLDVLSRFVFVLRAIEGYRRRETALLLNIDDRVCEWTYLRAARELHEDMEPECVPPVFGWPLKAEWVLAQAGD